MSDRLTDGQTKETAQKMNGKPGDEENIFSAKKGPKRVNKKSNLKVKRDFSLVQNTRKQPRKKTRGKKRQNKKNI